MGNDVFDFLWSVPDAGFHWIEVTTLPDETDQDPGANEPQWVLTTGLTVGTPYRMKRYSPLREHSGLFRTFEQTPPTREGILAFAKKYGYLGIAVPLQIMAPQDPNQLLGVWGETQQDWVKEIDSLRRAVAIWDMARSNDVTGLKRLLRWKRAGRKEYWIYDSHPDLPHFKDDWRQAIPPPPGRFEEMIEPVDDLIKPDDVGTAALFLIQRWINKHLKDTVAPRIVYHTDLRKHVLRFVPKSLVGALWLQFAQAIDADKEYRACKTCGKWYEISLEGDGRTQRRLFCSEPCKSKDYRRRRDQARQWRAEGWPVRAIATKLDTAIATIKQWVGKRTK